MQKELNPIHLAAVIHLVECVTRSALGGGRAHPPENIQPSEIVLTLC
jgi:hypothetical protein